MKKAASAIVAAATIAGSFTATSTRQAWRSPRRPDRYWPAPYGAGPGPYDDLAVANG